MDTDTKNHVFALRFIEEIPGFTVFPTIERKAGWYGKSELASPTMSCQSSRARGPNRIVGDRTLPSKTSHHRVPFTTFNSLSKPGLCIYTRGKVLYRRSNCVDARCHNLQYMHAGWLTISQSSPYDRKAIDDIKANLKNFHRARRIPVYSIQAVEFSIVMFLMELEPPPWHYETACQIASSFESQCTSAPGFDHYV